MKRYTKGIWYGIGAAVGTDALVQTVISQSTTIHGGLALLAGLAVWNHYRREDNADGSHTIRTDCWTWPVPLFTAYGVIHHILSTDRYIDTFGASSGWSIAKVDKQNGTIEASIAVKQSEGSYNSVTSHTSNVFLKAALSPLGDGTQVVLRWGGTHPEGYDKVWKGFIEGTRAKFQSAMEKQTHEHA